jgi:hypothetical protein
MDKIGDRRAETGYRISILDARYWIKKSGWCELEIRNKKLETCLKHET